MDFATVCANTLVKQVATLSGLSPHTCRDLKRLHNLQPGYSDTRLTASPLDLWYAQKRAGRVLCQGYGASWIQR